jgi:isopenicillin N synthase-like dioxygenase
VINDMVHGQKNYDKDPVAQQSSVLDQVPIIDISQLLVDSNSVDATPAIEQIASACSSWGFFQITNHGIADELIKDVLRQTQAFFALPIEEKLKILRSRDNPWGFYHNELTKNQRDKKQVFDFTREGRDPIYGKSNRWPEDQAQFKATMQTYFDACTELSLKLLEAFCIGLDLPAQFMHADFANNHTGGCRPRCTSSHRFGRAHRVDPGRS